MNEPITLSIRATDHTEPEMFAAPAQAAAVHPEAGEVWLLPPAGYTSRRRVAVRDFNGVLQLVTYFGGRAFHHEGTVPDEVRDSIVAACKYVREEYLRSEIPARPVVSQWVDEAGVQVVQIDTTASSGHVRVRLDDVTLLELDASSTNEGGNA